MNNTTENDRARWEARWRTTVWEWAAAGQWLPLASMSASPLVVVTAWNPDGQLLPEAINRARDVMLLAELRALGCDPLRARGRSPDGTWHEDGWQIPHVPVRTLMLLRRYGQIAGWVTDADGAHYHWCEPLGEVP
jgi:hypothetical protein